MNKKQIKDFFNITTVEADTFMKTHGYNARNTYRTTLKTLDKDLNIVPIEAIAFRYYETWNVHFYDKDMFEYVQASVNQPDENFKDYIYIKKTDDIKPIAVCGDVPYPFTATEETLKFYDFKKCPICGKYEHALKGNHYFIEKDGQFYCPACYEKEFVN